MTDPHTFKGTLAMVEKEDEGGMPAISLWQPYASLIFSWDQERGDFAKVNETRGFKLPKGLIGEWVGIHATARFPAAKFISEELHELCYSLFGCGYNYSLPFGAIIGQVRFGSPTPTETIAAHQPATEITAGDWAPGRWAWPIVEVVGCSPVEVKGRQGWWRFNPQAIAKAREPQP